MSVKQKAAFGSWKSPITTDLMLSDSVGLGEIGVYNNDLYWIEMRPQEKGRYVVVKQTVDGTQTDFISEKYNARTRVHEYGGGSYLVTEKGLVFVNFKDQKLYLKNLNDEYTQLANKEACRYADMIYDAKYDRLICIREDHTDNGKEAINTIVSISLTESGNEKILVEGADFYSNPRLSPDGSQLCWVEWNHPNMPWDNTSLLVTEIISEEKLSEHLVIVSDGESACQPVWSEDNNLYFISDRNNWWNIYRFVDNKVECIFEMEAEFAVPQWSFRESNFVFTDKDTIAAIYRKEGIAYLGLINLINKELETQSLPFTDFESIVCENNHIFCLAGSPETFPSIIDYNLKRKEFTVVRKANNLEVDQDYISKGQSLRFPVNDEQHAHAFFYHPENKDFTGDHNELPPLIVMSHGGPTGVSHNGLKMVIQFFTSRGFAVLDVNYGGSTGYGRKYRQRLNGEWGRVDVQDCSQAALYVAEKEWVDKDRLAIRGGSAGGYTTLASLTFTDVFKAGASHYGVSDLEALAKETHKFESRYLDNLIGPYPEAKEIYQIRSPINAVDQLSCPVIFFQGLEDKIVLPNQAEMMVNALKEKNIPVVYIAYESEQHGFRQAKNIKRTLEAEFYFYSTIFGFECADQIEPVTFL